MGDVENGQRQIQGGSLAGRLEAGGIRAWRIMTHPFTGMANAVTGSITNSATKSIEKAAEQELKDFREYVNNGHWSFQVLGCFGGILMTVAGLYNLLYDILGLSPFDAIVDAYVGCFGILSVCLEYKTTLLGDDFAKTLRDEFRFIYKPYGRAFLYILFGLLMFSESGSLVYMIAGPYVTAVGLFSFWVFWQAEKEYARMREGHKLDDTHLRSEFNKADKGNFLTRDGKLDSGEFAVLYKDLLHLSGPPSMNELQMALLEIDRNNDGTISFDELKTWYHKTIDAQ